MTNVTLCVIPYGIPHYCCCVPVFAIFGGKYIHHIINRGFSSRDQNWGPCRYAQLSLRALLYGSRTLCGAVAWLVDVVVGCGNDFSEEESQVVVQAIRIRDFIYYLFGIPSHYRFA
jgi:hypothetical protein